MGSPKSIGRIIGFLILVQMAAGSLVYFVLFRPLTTPPGFLENAAASSLQIGVAVVLYLAAGALSIGIATAAWPVFHHYSSRMALGFLSLSVVAFSLIAVENSAVMTMLSVSQAYVAASAPDDGLFETLGLALRSARNWAHLTTALVMEGVIFLLFSILYRFALVPRALSASGLVAGLLKITALAMPFFGRPVVVLMTLPLALAYLALALWLMAKGFENRPHPIRSGAQGGTEIQGP